MGGDWKDQLMECADYENLGFCVMGALGFCSHLSTAFSEGSTLSWGSPGLIWA